LTSPVPPVSSDTELPLNALTALSPLDGRYGSKTTSLRPWFSEFGLIHARIRVEIEWLIKLSATDGIEEVRHFNDEDTAFLRSITDGFSMADAEAVKKIERTTNHDVKAVEYFLKDKINGRPALEQVSEFFHFACT